MKIVQTNITNLNYIQLDIDSLKIGENLVFNVFIKREDDYIVIIEAGTILSEVLFKKLQNKDRLYIFKKDENKQELTYKTLYTHIRYNKNDLKKSLHLLYDVNTQLFTDFLNSAEDIIDLAYLKEIVKSIIFFRFSDANKIKGVNPRVNQ